VPAACLAGVLATACGSTVAVSSTATQPGGGLAGQDGTGTTGGQSLPGSDLAAPGSSGGTVSPGTSVVIGGSRPTTAPVATTGTSVPGGIAAPGVIKIGLAVTKPGDTIQTGATGVGFADEQAQAKAVVDYLNEHGGMAKRRIVPVWVLHGDEGASSNTATTAQQDCAAFTEDNHVFAAYQSSASSYSIALLADCLAKKKTVFVMDSNSVQDDVEFRRWAPYVYAPGMLGGQRWRGVADGLVSLGYFDRGAKVGVVAYDQPAVHRLADRLESWLAPHGIKVSDTQWVPNGVDYAGFGRGGAQINNIVLRFQTEGITHVVLLGTTGTGGYLFPTAAQAQGYHPRYAFTTSEFPEVIAQNAPPEQLRRALGVGWDPVWDVAAAQDPRDNPAQQLCLDIFRKAGVSSQERAATRRALGICSALFFLKTSLDRAPVVSAQGLRATVGGSAYRFASATTPLSTFAGGRFDGASRARGLAYDEACRCWHYRGAWFSAS
jgi:hypothetical protein